VNATRFKNEEKRFLKTDRNLWKTFCACACKKKTAWPGRPHLPAEYNRQMGGQTKRRLPTTLPSYQAVANFE